MTTSIFTVTLIMLVLMYFGKKDHHKVLFWIAFGILLLTFCFATWLILVLIPSM